VLSLSIKNGFPENLLREFGHKLMNSRIESSTEPRQRPGRFNISLRILATSKTALRNVWTSVTIGGRERVFQANAIYFRDPLVAPQTMTPRSVDVAILMAILLGYFDLALEWAALGDGLGAAAADLAGAVDRIAKVDPAESRAELAALIEAIDRDPQLGHVLVGKFVDRFRDLATFHDIAVPSA
jgi:hypothetical protein